MHTEFKNVDHNLIRYSLVWEGANTLYRGLDLQPQDDILMITSAGCNVLNALLKNPKQLTAIDINPEQNRLLLFKKHIIEKHKHQILIDLMGFCGRDAVTKAWKEVATTLDPEIKEHWEGFFSHNPKGILFSGKLESYILNFYPGLPEEIQQKLKHLISFSTIESQKDYFEKELEGSLFEEKFIEYFDQQNLSKGRDPKLFRYVKESGGQIFYSRLKQIIERQVLKDNFYFRFFIFGPLELPASILPPCYREENFQKLKGALPSLKVVTGEAIDYLLSPEGLHINKAGLSNIFEYVDEDQFRNVCHRLLNTRENPLRIIFWNLLQSQGDAHCTNFLLEKESGFLSQGEPCFYFQNVRVMESVNKN